MSDSTPKGDERGGKHKNNFVETHSGNQYHVRLIFITVCLD
ncbi:hypothetical protein HMPREF0293_1857 [Corynebacterium glucuronolyticum ATCC 51866]|uniref:Uncharacterized protein n=1 Tax=Corynebacterium glucuronolyticum ATCC 51866 TaxID=548478 RepID=A0ABM9XNG4_9CORY|nr:hypothetical protein HMPREF0293_1857 [Corynebacterium glucuronolyticum ATCC 51866]